MNIEAINLLIEEIVNQIKYEDFDSAEIVLNDTLKEIDDFYEETEETIYFCFDSPLQFYIYDLKFSPNKVLKRCPVDFRTLYFCESLINKNKGDYKASEQSFIKALKYSPIDPNLFFGLSKLYSETKEWNKLKIVLTPLNSYVLDSELLSKYYRELAQYFIGMNNLKFALAMFLMSENISPTKEAKLGYQYVMDLDNSLIAPSADEVLEEFNKQGFSIGLDKDVITMIDQVSKDLEKDLNHNGVKYCLSILYDLTKDDKYLREIEKFEV